MKRFTPFLKESDFLLLDMDGTLLDKHFDDFFWEYFLPQKYAEKNNIPIEISQKTLLEKYKKYEGTLKWTDINFWSKELDLDILSLKEEIQHIIEKHPYVEEFLDNMKKKGKKLFLLTDAHYKSIELKLKKTDLGGYFDDILSSFDVGFPKGDFRFWEKAEGRLGFKKEKSLFIDDIESILKTAKDFGIRYLLFKATSNSKKEPNISKEFPKFHDFRELM